ncbi:hypothetical protein DPO11_10970 [Salmonella enterica]|nr:hypothetical protein [Salmonella enterica]
MALLSQKIQATDRKQLSALAQLFITDIYASPVAGQKAEKCHYLKWLQVTMRVENTSTQQPAARQENN